MHETLTLRTISPDLLESFARSYSHASFLQLPQWAGVKAEWRNECVGWFTGNGELVGAGLILYRDAPVIKKSLAYLPEGPLIDWSDQRGFGLNAWLSPLLAHVKQRGAFTIKIGAPVIARTWSADVIKSAIETDARKLGEVEPSTVVSAASRVRTQLRQLGWTQQTADSGFGDVQPRYVYQVAVENMSDEELLTGFNQLWRRNIKKAEKSGVIVRAGSRDDLAAFHTVYVETAERDHFRPRPLSYFERMWDAMATADGLLSLYLAEVDGEVAAATLMVVVGDHAWYSYGASTTRHRDLRPSNAIQWHMIRAARDAGATVYDLRGISDTLDESHPLFGLIRFKLGIGGYAAEFVGEHDFALNRMVNAAFNLYMRLR